MHSEDIKNAVIECFQDTRFIAQLQEKLLAPIVGRYVAEAVQAKNQEIENLRAQLSTQERRSIAWNSIPGGTL